MGVKMSKRYSRLVRVDFDTFNLALDIKNKKGYKSLNEVFGDSIFILNNKDIKKRRFLKELEF